MGRRLGGKIHTFHLFTKVISLFDKHEPGAYTVVLGKINNNRKGELAESGKDCSQELWFTGLG